MRQKRMPGQESDPRCGHPGEDGVIAWRPRMVHHHPMEHSPDGTERDGTSGQPGLPGESQVMLAEYSALRAEIDRRANVQWNVLALQVTSAGAVAGLVLSISSDPPCC